MELQVLDARQRIGARRREAARARHRDVRRVVDDRVVARVASEHRRVHTRAASQHVGASAAQERVVAGEALENVVCRTAGNDVVERVARDVHGDGSAFGVIVRQRDVRDACVEGQVEIGRPVLGLHEEVVDRDRLAHRAGTGRVDNDPVARGRQRLGIGERAGEFRVEVRRVRNTG